ncbi:hypothetical protein [Paraburkholderia phenazinium]|uniref:hypothetical protein n=1 Tax=Paraburkholderia phenazinium TaxID=60549 RepID=UPI00158E9927|nr:hypothetical protein [Paraburkholderia phenazinium]
MRTLMLFVRYQWSERIATSSFLIGITLQTAAMCLAVWSRAGSPTEVGQFASRSALFTATNIILLGAMSNISNEFKFFTIQHVYTSYFGFPRLIFFRSVANSVICAPAVLMPIVVACVRFGRCDLATLAVLGLSFVWLAALCYVATYLTNLAAQPLAAVPWLKYAFVLFGLDLLPLPGGANLLFPSHWIVTLTHANLSGHLCGFALTTSGAVALCFLVTRSKVERIVEEAIKSGRRAA